MLQSLLNKYRNMAAPVKASLWFLVCGFISKGMSMLTTPIFTRVMTESEYGRASLYTSWYNILFIIATLELAAGVYTKGLVNNSDKKDEFSSSLLSLSTVCLGIFTCVYLIFHSQINKFTGLSTYLTIMMIAEMGAVVAYQFWSNRERVAYRYKKLVALMLAIVVLRPLAGVVAVLFADEAYQVEAKVSAVVIVSVLLYGGLYISIMKKGKTFFHKEFWLSALKFNLPLIPHYLSQMILNQSDRIMIEKLCDTSAVGFYSVAYSLAMVMQILNSSVSSTMNPWIYQSLKDKQYAKIQKVSNTVLVIIACANLFVVALGPELLSLMAPSSYSQAVWVIPPVTLSVYFMFLYNLFATFEYYYNKTQWVMVASIIGAVTNIALNYIFIPKYGFVAAGYTTLVSNILFVFMHGVFMVRVCDKYMDGARVYDIKRIVLIGVAVTAASGVMYALYEYFLIRMIVLLVMILVAIHFRSKILSVFAEMKKKPVN